MVKIISNTRHQYQDINDNILIIKTLKELCETLYTHDVAGSDGYEWILHHFGLAPTEIPVKVSTLLALICNKWNMNELSKEDLNAITEGIRRVG